MGTLHVSFCFQLVLKENPGGALIRSFVQIFTWCYMCTDVFCDQMM